MTSDERASRSRQKARRWTETPQRHATANQFPGNTRESLRLRPCIELKRSLVFTLVGVRGRCLKQNRAALRRRRRRRPANHGRGACNDVYSIRVPSFVIFLLLRGKLTGVPDLLSVWCMCIRLCHPRHKRENLTMNAHQILLTRRSLFLAGFGPSSSVSCNAAFQKLTRCITVRVALVEEVID